MRTNDVVKRNVSVTHVLFLKSVLGYASLTAVILESYPGEIIWASSYQQTLRVGAAEVPDEVRTAGRYSGGINQPEKYVHKAKAVSVALKSVDMHMKKVVDITNSARNIPSVVVPVVVPTTQAVAPIIHDTTNFDRLKSEAEQNLKQLCDTLPLLREEEVSIKLRDPDAPVCLSLLFLGCKKNPILQRGGSDGCHYTEEVFKAANVPPRQTCTVSFRNRMFPNPVPEGEDEEETPATPPEVPPTVNPVRRRSSRRNNA